ncbi:MAG: GNAT family N-acetyltransferase [Syntrophomonadaceae bacterium]
MVITYRSAQNNDCPILAEYIYFASDGVLDYLFKDTIADITVTQLLTFGLEDEQRYNSYKGIVVAEHNQQIVGIIQAYSNIHHQIDDEMRYFIPGERLDQFREFYDSRVDNSLLINAIYVDEKFRRQGIANQLISMVREEASSLDFDELSLFVFSDNIPAQKLYYSNGFKTVKEIAFNDSVKINHEGVIHLMACAI